MYTLARQQDTRQPFHRPFRRVFNSPCNDFELFPRLAPFLDRKDVRTKYYEPWQVECIYREAIEKGWSGLLVWNSDIVIGNSIIFPLLFLLSLPKTFFLETVNGWIKKVQKCKELNIQFLVFLIKIILLQIFTILSLNHYLYTSIKLSIQNISEQLANNSFHSQKVIAAWSWQRWTVHNLIYECIFREWWTVARRVDS